MLNNMKNLQLPQIWPVACHTDNIGQGSTFVAVKGHQTDGLKFVELALQKGANKIVVDQLALSDNVINLVNSFKAKLIVVPDTRVALSNLSAQAWGYPAKSIKIIGVTGTKGKTTTVYALSHILRVSGKAVAMITGVQNMIGNQKLAANLTTPHPDYLHMFLAQCLNAKIEYLVMEVSAQALSLGRVDDLLFTGVVFTNLELEHSEFYSSIENYFAAKCKIFNLLKMEGFAVLNLDDTWTPKIKLENIKTITFSQYPNFDYQLKLLQPNLVAGLEFNLVNQGNTLHYLANHLYGVFNAYNLTCAILCAQQLGLSYDQISLAINSFTSAPGRLEIYQLSNGARGVVDYAHTPSSFINILTLLRSQTSHLIVIFGAGGGRDPIKRPVMGQIATQFGDLVILTNDNPRNENPAHIIQQIIGLQDARKFLVEYDRAQAIKTAYQLSSPNSIIVLLGKGPDEYQIIGNQKHFFSDRQQLQIL